METPTLQKERLVPSCLVGTLIRFLVLLQFGSLTHPDHLYLCQHPFDLVREWLTPFLLSLFSWPLSWFLFVENETGEEEDTEDDEDTGDEREIWSVKHVTEETTQGESEDLYDKLMEMVGWKIPDNENENENDLILVWHHEMGMFHPLFHTP